MDHDADIYRHDHAVRRRSVRYGRQKGVTIFIPAYDLRRAGIDPDAEPPWYRTAGTNVRGKRVIVNLYPTGN
jgi:hypothetical protein